MIDVALPRGPDRFETALVHSNPVDRAAHYRQPLLAPSNAAVTHTSHREGDPAHWLERQALQQQSGVRDMKLSGSFEVVGWFARGLRACGAPSAALALLAASPTFAVPSDWPLLAQLQDVPGAREVQRAAREAERAARNARTAERQAERAAQNADREAERVAREGELRATGAARRSARDQRETDCGRIQAWLSDTAGVPPEVLERRFGGGAGRTDPAAAAVQLPYESWLFQDARFASAFGKRFDEVPAEERATLQTAGNGCISPRNARGQAISDNVLFLRAFDPRYHPGYAQGVQKIREAQTQIDAAKKDLALLAPDDDGLRRYRELAAQAARLRLFLGVEQRSAYEQALAQAQTRVAQPVLARRAGDAVAQAKGYAGLTALVELQAEMTRDGGAVPPGLRERQTQIALELVAHERARVDALGNGLVGLERGVQWHREYAIRYGAKLVPAVPQLRAMLEHFEVRRAAILDASQAELGARIVQVKSDGELQQLVAQYVPLEFDQRQTSGTGLMTRVAAQRETLHKRSVIGTPPTAPTQPATQAPAAPARAPVASADGGPSESEMYDAFNQLLQAQNAQAAGVAERCNNRDFQGDAVLAMQCLQYGMGVGTTRGGQGVLAPQFKISRFEKLGCEKAQGEAGFRCDYVAGIAGNVNLPPSLGAIVSNGSVTQARFVKRGSGWLMLPDRSR